jgi:N-acetylneuraminic acid mutarotase
VTGGNHYGGGLSSVERYDPLTNSWTIVAPMSTARKKHVSAALDGKLYACGGWDESTRTALTSVERYDPDTDSWETVAPMKTARYLSSAAVIDGKLYVAGGEIGTTEISTVERYDPSANVWEEVPPMIKARSDFVLCSFD